MKSKICRRCEEDKELSEYYKHKEMFDGYLNICKECTKKRVGNHRENNIEKVREYDRNRPNKEERNKKHIKRMHNLSDDKKENYKKVKDKWHNKGLSKNKKAVNIYLLNAIRGGKITKPLNCEHCKEETKLQGHHPDYLKPLEVVWLCTQCHAKEHVRLRNLERGKT